MRMVDRFQSAAEGTSPRGFTEDALPSCPLWFLGWVRRGLPLPTRQREVEQREDLMEPAMYDRAVSRDR